MFTQFRELTEPLERFLAEIFGRPGLRLDGRTPEILAVDGATRLTEMSTEELMRTVRLDLEGAVHGA